MILLLGSEEQRQTHDDQVKGDGPSILDEHGQDREGKGRTVYFHFGTVSKLRMSMVQGHQECPSQTCGRMAESVLRLVAVHCSGCIASNAVPEIPGSICPQSKAIADKWHIF